MSAFESIGPRKQVVRGICSMALAHSSGLEEPLLNISSGKSVLESTSGIVHHVWRADGSRKALCFQNGVTRIASIHQWTTQNEDNILVAALIIAESARGLAYAYFKLALLGETHNESKQIIGLLQSVYIWR